MELPGFIKSAGARLSRNPEGSEGGDDHAAPEGTPWRYRNPQAFKRLLAGCGLGVIALAAALVVILRPFDATPDKVQAALVQSRTAVIQTTADVEAAEKLREIRTAGRAAEARLPVIDRSLAAVRATNDPHYVRPSVILLEAERRYVEAVAATQDLSDTKLRRWKKLRIDATVEKKKVGAVHPFIASLGVGEPNQVMPTTAQLEEPLAHLDTTIKAAAREIGPWLRRLYAAKMRKKLELQGLGEYMASMESGDKAYTEMRNDTQSWSDSVAANGSTYEDAYIYLYGAREKRVALRDQMEAAQRPSEAESQHQELVSILNDSIALIEDAGYGINDEQTGYENDYRNSEGWQRFQSGSDQISGDWPATMEALRSAVAEARKRVEARKMPKRPDV